jgi:flagellar motility protein MotE (MotC chaperone)
LELSFDHIDQLFKSHPAIRLLRAEHAPLMLSFFNRVFVQPNVRVMSQSEIASRLDDTLYHLRERGEDYPRGAQVYLDEWAHNEKGWLRKFYPENTDEPHYDLTPSAEKALSWIESLSAREFVGTESRLLTIFELLRQMVLGTEMDAETRITELERQKQKLDDEIGAIRRGEIEVMDRTALRDRFMQFGSMAKELLSDFRTVEHNFRRLDTKIREQIAAWDGSKGKLLEQIFGERDAIIDSDQGRSFRAFWDFLMSPESQEELSHLLEKVFTLDAIAGFTEDKRLKRIHFDWLDAGEHTQRTVANLSAQLRRYLDNQAYLENKRIMALFDSISSSALAVKESLPSGIFMSVDDPAPGIALPMERPMFTPFVQARIEAEVLAADGSDIDYRTLLEQVYVDRGALYSTIRNELLEKGQVYLHDLIKKYPLKKGLAELVTYVAIASDDPLTIFDEEKRVEIEWQDTTGVEKRALIPLIILNRKNK